MRPAHVLRDNVGAQRPSHHLFVDVEASLVPLDEHRTEQRLLLGWCCYWGQRANRPTDTIHYQRFTTVQEFWESATGYTQRDSPLYLIAHNIQYDFGVLRVFDNLAARGYELRGVYLSGMTAIITFVKGHRKIIILDNGNYFPGKLADLGEEIGYPKVELDPTAATPAELDPYCRRDVEIMLKAWQGFYAFLDRGDLGSWKRTLPSQAFSAYRHRFMPHPIYIHNRPRALELEREAYHGGRTSAFYKGTLADGPYYILDVNSMYPYVMQHRPFPHRLRRVIPSMGAEELWRHTRTYAAVAQVTVETPDPIYPVTHDHHLVHPVGTFDTTLCTPELEYALAHDHVRSVRRTVLYDQAMLFADYVQYFYDQKLAYGEAGQLVHRTIAKLYLNSLYGKFGQKAQRWARVDDPQLVDLGVCRYFDARTRTEHVLYPFDGRAWLRTDRGESYHSFPAIAGHVTAYARMYLWSLIEEAGREHCYYCDTDSLFVDRVGLGNLEGRLHPTRIGALRVEATARAVIIKCPKCYAIDGQWTRKGIPTKAKYLGNDTWEYDQFPGFGVQARWAPHTPFHTRTVRKKLTYRIHDGKETDDGWIAPLQAADAFPDRALSEEEEMDLRELRQRKAFLDARPRLDRAIVRELQRDGGAILGGLRGSVCYVPWPSDKALRELATRAGLASVADLVLAAQRTIEGAREAAAVGQRIAKLTRGE